MEKIRISLVQTALHWESPERNLGRLGDRLAELENRTDWIILPEMFPTGFSMRALHLAEAMDGRSVGWMRDKAAELDAVLIGSLMVREGGHYYNRLIWMPPDGKHLQYDKKHLFTLAKEHHTFTAGRRKLVVEWKGWKICPLICYDLRFPVWSRNVEDYDVLVYVANFPAKRRYAWRHLIRARAIENQCYVLAVNIVGQDGNGITYSGDSSIINPMGRAEKELTEQEGIIQGDINLSELRDIRKKLPFLAGRD